MLELMIVWPGYSKKFTDRKRASINSTLQSRKSKVNHQKIVALPQTTAETHRSTKNPSRDTLSGLS